MDINPSEIKKKKTYIGIHFIKEDIQIPIKQCKICWASLIIKQMQTKPQYKTSTHCPESWDDNDDEEEDGN